MAFESVTPIAKSPARIEMLSVTLQYSYQTTEGVEELAKSAKYKIEVSDSVGGKPSEWERAGNLVPHLSAAQQRALTSFMDAMWAKAAEVMPV